MLASWMFLWLATVGVQPGAAQSIGVLQLTGDSSASGTVVSLDRPSGAAPDTVVYPASIDIGAFDDPDAILRYRAGITTEIAIETQVVGDSYELYSLYGASQTLPATNASGDVLFTAEFQPLGGPVVDDGIFLFDHASGAIESVVLDGDVVVDGNGFLDVNLANHPALADDGRVAFWASIYGAIGGLGNGAGIYRWQDGSLTRIVRTGQTAPGGGIFDAFTWPSLNQVGDVALVGFLDSGAEGIYRGNGGAPVEIARTGTESPPGWLITDLAPVEGVAVNDTGQVAFRAFVDPPGCCGLARAIYLGSGGALTMLAFGGQAVPGGGTVPNSISRNLTLNNQGQVAFGASFSGSASGLFRVDAGGLLRIAQIGDLVPGSTSQTFVWVSGYDYAINERGDIAFIASFDNGTEFVEGLFLYTDTAGLRRVVEPGTPLLGSTVIAIDFVGTNVSDWRSGEPSGLDDDGSVVFRFRLADERRGIGVFRSAAIFSDGFESGDLSRWSASVP